MKPTRYVTPRSRILQIIEEESLPGENRFETANRLVLNAALAASGGVQKRAALSLRVSTRHLNYRAGKLALRPKDEAEK